MKIGVISDTHDRRQGIDSALAFFVSQKINTLIHCGDWKTLETTHYIAQRCSELSLPLFGVLGNNDLDVDAFLSFANTQSHFTLQEGILECVIDTRSVAIYHGHHQPTLRKLIANNNYDIILLGHTHKPRIDTSSGKLIVNPGSTAFFIPRSKSWLPTVAIVDTDTAHASLHTLNSSD